MHQFTSKYKKIAENERNAQNQGKSGILAHISKIGHISIYIKHHPLRKVGPNNKPLQI